LHIRAANDVLPAFTTLSGEIHMKRSTLPAAAVALSLLSLAGACKGSGGDAARDSAAAAPAAAAPTTTDTTRPAGGLTDANIVYILDQANAADSARGHLAQTKATSADVKSYGKLMMGEHHAIRQQGQALATKLGVTPQAPANDQGEAQAKQEMDSLNAMAKGKAWDKAYIDYEVGYHQALLETATKALGAAQNQELKDLIQKAAPVVQHHLDRAKEIQAKLGS
jgi:putative membrane protein